MNKVILPYICCECIKVDAIVIDEKSWLKYKDKKSYLKGLCIDGKTLCEKCSGKYKK